MAAELFKFIGGAGRRKKRNTIIDDEEQAGRLRQDLPLRAELYSVEQLERHARKIAGEHRMARAPAPDRLIARLNENEQILIQTYDLLLEAVKKDRRIVPAGEWLLDNFYVIEDQIRGIRQHLPKSYSRELPRLAGGQWAGMPRVYVMALELISHVDGGVDAVNLNAFVHSYQTVSALRLGELWAVPIMLRLALLENLRRVSMRLAQGRRDRNIASEWAERLANVAESNPSDLIVVLADMAKARVRLTSALVAELTRQLQGQGQHLPFVRSWLDHQVAMLGHKIDQMVLIESQSQAADQVSIGNSITSLRFLSSIDWREFVEGQSLVERTLREDPAGVYGGMDFGSRDLYRHAVESIAKQSGREEGDVAREALLAAERGGAAGDDPRWRHVGFYLIGKGREQFARDAGVKITAMRRLRTAAVGARLAIYVSAVMGISLAIAASLAWLAWRAGAPALWIGLLALPVYLCASQMMLGVVNSFLTIVIRPRIIPRMDYKHGIPPDQKTLVAVPTMLVGVAGIEDLALRLETYYLANQDENLHFALLTDFLDAGVESMPGDENLLGAARRCIEELNRKYARDRRDIFFLFHRPRLWNAQERCWMGRERKRGKLADLNAFLRGRANGAFTEIIGETEVLRRIRYVITLDTDTQLPRESAHKMVGAMAHLLNRPVLDRDGNCVRDGYGILQPRVGVRLPSASRSWFARLHTAEAGLDPYTRMVSDVYQDVFEEGSFIGKGIYDVDAFRSACGRFPDNLILSHDLLEGAHARSALLSDVEVYEDFPSRLMADASRRERWMRGDWQIAWWLMPRVPAKSGFARNPISALSKWKIFDNLRRSLFAPAMLAVLATAWLSPWVNLAAGATLFALVVVAAPTLLGGAVRVLRRPKGLPWDLHLLAAGPVLLGQLAQVLLTLVFLPFDAWLSLNAIGRTLWRVLVSRRNLLQWTTAHEAERVARTNIAGLFKNMWFAPLFAATLAAAVAALRPENLGAGAGLLALWLAAPVAAWFLSRPIRTRQTILGQDDIEFLGRIARQTWDYFETFVNARENWLPPDNFQEHPAPVIASRTSPTNIGLGLLANLAAYDFGYATATTVIDRTRSMLDAMDLLERYRGHFYNWYDTQRMRPLAPRYVSSVDSGNLAGFLIVLAQGLRDLAEARLVPQRLFGGLLDSYHAMTQEAASLAQAGNGTFDVQRWRARSERVEQALRAAQDEPQCVSGVLAALDRLLEMAEELEPVHDEAADYRRWVESFRRALRDHRDDLDRLAPWARLAAAAEWDGHPELAARIAELDRGVTLEAAARLKQSLVPLIREAADRADGEVAVALNRLRDAVATSADRALRQIHDLRQLAERAGEFAEMDFDFLYDRGRKLYSIGYNADSHRLDISHYDLLASEARLLSYMTIAKGELDQEHWFSLGRMLTTTTGAPALLSWSGSMFEYLMPLLVMPTYENSLLDYTYRAVVRRQIDYGRQRGVPWGMSESAYNAVDAHLTYQYRAFGVPGLGLKRGLADDLVIAPYATMLALMIDPEAACRNLERLEADGLRGAFGFYEAVDYTPTRVPRGAQSVTIRAYFAHHQGMSLLALAHVLAGRPMQRRFDADARFRAADLLLHERVPKAVAPVFPHAVEAATVHASAEGQEESIRIIQNPGGSIPEINLLSNGRYHVMITAAGGSSSRWQELAVTRWREDPTRDCWGTFCYIRDIESGKYWSNALQPTLRPSSAYQAIFTQSKAEFRRVDDDIESLTEVSVSPEDDIELRRITVINRSGRMRVIELTSYAEVVLAHPVADQSHPAFSNLFVQTELVPEKNGILCTRRPRSADEQPPWMMHLMTIHGSEQGEPSYETDRMKFIGRNRTPLNPESMESPALTGSAGPVLDPVVAIRRTLRLGPNEIARVVIVTGMAATRDAARSLLEKYHDIRLADRVFELAWTHGHVVLRQINITEGDAQVFGRLAGAIVFASGQRRANPSILARNRRGQAGLWGHGISGDLPIMLVRIRDSAKLDLARQALWAHAFWRIKGLAADLVIWNEDDSVYRQSLHESILAMIAQSPNAGFVDQPGGVFLRRGEQIPEEDRVLLLTAARVVLTEDAGTLREQTERRTKTSIYAPALKPARKPSPPQIFEPASRDLIFYNGIGGFTRDGREYVMLLRAGRQTPLPWVNVIANPQFGTLVSEAGSVYTWGENCHEFRLTPWGNDPVSGNLGEALYLRDDESGRFWSPTPLPAPGWSPYVVRHGFGYTIFENTEDGVTAELTLHVSPDDPVKFVRLKIANRSGRQRRLSAFGYWELVLGELRPRTAMHVVSEIDPATGAIFARNAYHPEMGNRIAFFGTGESARTLTGDRAEFIGRNGTPADPAAMRRLRLSGHAGAGLDPCAAIHVPLTLDDGQEHEIIFYVGSAQSEEHARQVIERIQGGYQAQRALEATWHYWARTLGVLYVESPDPAFNFLVNGWLVYQTLACRMWARTGFYQSGGAYGFRDQLQDAMALVHADPLQLREHLLRAASRQFKEGDVQHWWHPQSGRGVRTHCSDDYLWLPYAACRYAAGTGDTGFWDEQVGFLGGRAIRPDEEGYYDLPEILHETASLYEHCVLAIENGLNYGEHGLPLMGSGDWNDGMNLVGVEGKGESVWLAFFLYDVLTRFAGQARERGDTPFADRCLAEAGDLRRRIEESAWDGAWYLRAWFDDGTPLGSAENDECQIDSLPQSWAALTGAGERGRTKTALESVDRRLVREDIGIIQLFDPPFDKSDLNPGYIKGYIPGVRENGGQYTHAAIWTVMANAAMGHAERAWRLFSMMNPIAHGDSAEEIHTYKVEPYVVAADVYAVPPNTGRGGWTWYTGSAGWMYRLLTEYLLGVELAVDTLRFAPCLPPHWREFTLHYRYRETFYHFVFVNGGGGKLVRRVELDGIEQPEKSIRMLDDRIDHHGRVEIE